MTVDLILVCEDPTFGVRGSRKFWAASLKDGEATVQTRWGRIPDGHTINVHWLRGQQHKSVECKNPEAAVKFIDKKATEKAEKGYKVVVHEVDGMDLSILHGTAADADGKITMQTRRGV